MFRPRTSWDVFPFVSENQDKISQEKNRVAHDSSAELLSTELKAWLDDVILPILLKEMLCD
jgi:cell pole-organizing protein PopZ